MTCWRTRRQVGAELDEHLGGDALALADEAEQDVLGADVVVAELQRLAQRQLEHLLGPRGERDVPGRRRAALADDLLDLAAHGLERDAEALERLGGDAFALVDQPEQDVLGADVGVVEQARFLLGEDHDPAGPVGEAFEHVRPFHERRVRVLTLPAAADPTGRSRAPSGRRGRPASGGDSVRRRRRSRLACSACPTPPTSPLLALAAMDADRERIEAAMRDAVVTPDAVPHRDRLPPDRRRRQAAAAGARGRRRPRSAGAPASRRRRARRRGLRARAPRLALPRRRDGRGRHPPRRRDRERQVGQPAGDPRRRLPAGPGVGDRRVARHRGRRPAGPHDRLAVRGPDRGAAPHLRRRPRRRPATSRRSTARRRRCSARRPASAASSPGSTAPTIDALTEYGNAYGMVFQIVDDVLDVTATDEQLGKPAGHDLVEGVYTLPVLRTLAERAQPRRRARATCSASRSSRSSATRRWRSCARTRASQSRDRHGAVYAGRRPASARRPRRHARRARPCGRPRRRSCRRRPPRRDVLSVGELGPRSTDRAAVSTRRGRRADGCAEAGRRARSRPGAGPAASWR